METPNNTLYFLALVAVIMSFFNTVVALLFLKKGVKGDTGMPGPQGPKGLDGRECECSCSECANFKQS